MANAKKTATKETKTTAPKPEVVDNESKSDKFQRLAIARTSKAVKAIYQIGNLGSANYESTPEQREKIKAALDTAVQSMINRLNKEVSKPSNFTL